MDFGVRMSLEIPDKFWFRDGRHIKGDTARLMDWFTPYIFAYFITKRPLGLGRVIISTDWITIQILYTMLRVRGQSALPNVMNYQKTNETRNQLASMRFPLRWLFDAE